MDKEVDLVRHLARLIRSRKATTFYLNGAPGSGKTYLLNRVADLMQKELSNAQVLGPYHFQPSEEVKLCKGILADCQDLGFVEHTVKVPSASHLTDTWLWLGAEMQVKAGQQFVVLADVECAEYPDLPSLASLFSSARYLEGKWDEQPFGVHIILAAYWDESILEAYFRQMQTSFPYSKDRNSTTWEGVSEVDLTEMVLKSGRNGVTPTHGQVLYELTGGLPAAALDVLSRVSLVPLSIAALLAATDLAAADGEAADKLLRVLLKLPPDCLALLHDLVLRRQISVSPTDPTVISLLTVGAVRLRHFGEQTYLQFRSWYVEIFVRSHLDILGIADPQTIAVRWKELLPEIHCVNVEAYRLINETENAVRNFVATHLCLVTPDDMPILRGRYKRLKDNLVEDTHQRASEWRTQSRGKKLPVDLNPLLAYCSTTDLAELIREIADELRSSEWRAVSVAMEDLSEIRNSVMHNQLIDDRCLERLHELQARVWEAASRTPPSTRRLTLA
jgi:hypothetical protein